MPSTFPATTPKTISTMATVTPSSTEIMLASKIKTLSTIATYSGLSKPHSLSKARQGEGPRHATYYCVVVRSHQVDYWCDRFPAPSGAGGRDPSPVVPC